MAEVKFCFACGAPRIEGGRFCPSCGKAYADATQLKEGQASVQPALAVEPTSPVQAAEVVQSTKTRSAQPLLLFSAFVLVVGLGAYFLIKASVSAKQPAGKSVAAEHDHEHDHEHAHGQLSEEDKAMLVELEQKAKDGTPEKVMELVEYLIALSMKDPAQLGHAAERLAELVSKHPNYGFGLRLLGNIYYQLRDPDHAEIYYRQYLELYPKDANVRTDYGSCRQANGDMAGALQAYTRALEEFPNFYHAYFNSALVYDNLGKKELAEEARRRAVEIDTRFGRLLAPENDLPRLPLPGDQAPPYKPEAQPKVLQEPVSIERAQASIRPQEAPAAGEPSQEGDEEPQTLAGLQAFFRSHTIIGPKVVDFQVKGDTAILSLRDFPMDQMPPNARQAFDKRIQTQMSLLPKGSKLEIRDAADKRLMVKYP